MSAHRRMQVDLWYPTADDPKEVEISLMAVRAANSIVVDYDFRRDGYRIRMSTIFEWEADDEVCDEGLVEVAFIPAWVEA